MDKILPDMSCWAIQDIALLDDLNMAIRQV